MCRQFEEDQEETDQEETDQEHADFMSGSRRDFEDDHMDEVDAFDSMDARDLERATEMRWGGFHE